MEDYRVKITIRNERLLAAMEGMGYKSVAEFSRNQGLNGIKVREIINGTITPLDKEGIPRELTKEVLEILNLTIEKAFTETQLKGFKKHTFEIKVEEEKLLQIINPAKNQEIKLIEQEVKDKLSEIFSKYLTPKEEKVLRMHYGIGLDTERTYDEIGSQLLVSRTRIGQIIMKALRKLKHPQVVGELMEAGAQDVFTKVKFKKINRSTQRLYSERE
jgi:RNA polymerase sigma factor (sigma-70 family)